MIIRDGTRRSCSCASLGAPISSVEHRLGTFTGHLVQKDEANLALNKRQRRADRANDLFTALLGRDYDRG